jgi:hypothetical protein
MVYEHGQQHGRFVGLSKIIQRQNPDAALMINLG